MRQQEQDRIKEDIRLSRYNEGYKFVRSCLGPFRTFPNPVSYEDVIDKVANALMSFEELLDYRTPKDLINGKCPTCGSEVSDSEFCSYCGQRIS